MELLLKKQEDGL